MSDYLWRKTLTYEAQLAEAIELVDQSALTEGHAGRDCLEMAEAYLDDGRHFLDRNDLPNALASFSYGHGWLDAGVRLEVLEVADAEPFTV